MTVDEAKGEISRSSFNGFNLIDNCTVVEKDVILDIIDNIHSEIHIGICENCKYNQDIDGLRYCYELDVYDMKYCNRFKMHN